MPGVLRPQTLVDVIATLNQQSTGTPDTSISGVGVFAEADDSMTLADSWTATTPINPAWDGGTWGQFTWG